jgi:hypothetical protein
MIYSETITEKMQKVAQAIFDNLDQDYYLAGGTAIALQLGHRKSIDLDYFINKNIDTNKLKNQILEIFDNSKITFTFEEKNTLWCIIDDVKVSFISRFDVLLENLVINDSFCLASLSDLTIMKLSAICSREEYKDYFDLACLSTVTDVRRWSNWWQKVYANSDPISFIIALSNSDNISKISLNINDSFKNISVKNILDKVVLEIKNSVF